MSKLGAGLFAIHDDEDAAEVMGVPTYRYKLIALAISCALAGVAGGIHALFLNYVTVGEVFTITVPLTVVLMSVLGGTRHWAGPAVGAVAITLLLYSFTAANYAVAGKAMVGVILIAAILFMPDGILPRLQRLWQRRRADAAGRGAAARDRCPPRRRTPAGAGGERAAAGPRPGQVLPRRAGAGRCRRRGAPRRDPRPARAQRLGQVDLHQRRQRPLPAQRRQRGLRGPASWPAARRTASPAPASRAPTRSRARSRTRRVLDNVALAAMFGGGLGSPAAARREAMTWLAFAGLQDKALDARPTTLNLHQRKFLELARALASRPRLVLLDEVLCGLTPSEIDDAVALVRRIRDQGSTVVFVEHVMRAVMALTDRVVVFDHGELLAEGPGGRGDAAARGDDAPTWARPRPPTREQRRPCLKCSDLQVAYGQAPALWGVSLRAARARAAVRRRPQRRRQDDADQHAGRRAARARGRIVFEGPRHHRACRRTASARPASPSCPRAGGCSHR